MMFLHSEDSSVKRGTGLVEMFGPCLRENGVICLRGKWAVER